MSDTLFDLEGNLRGHIRHADRRRQLILWHGLRYGTITPTDLDLLVDYHNEAFIFAELKYLDTPLGSGQGLAVKRIVDHLAHAGARATFIVASHGVHNPLEPIYAPECVIRARYERGQWTERDANQTLRQGMDRFLGVRSS
jgi:hypothetical protein